MIEGKTVLAIIPARGGSKGVPRKNIRCVAGKPLVAWTIEEAKKSKYIDRLILSSEDPEIISIAREWGCEVPFVRPYELAQDDTPGIEPVLHAMQVLPEEYDYVVLLQPTSPLRTAQDIDGCIERCIQQSANACVTLTESEKSPCWMYVLENDHRMTPLLVTETAPTRRQDAAKVYVLNGAVYVAKSDWLLKQRTFLTYETVGYLMPKERSLDIDTEFDMVLFEILTSLKICKFEYQVSSAKVMM
ncbi:acylneuraminate cytidylyltransferase family protein [Effusibacillus pohliae]|uniref:acylneuraminate cytidylyltransferase family protein n=1 Tax=Effusibacillus pohliae TaxID=232270 RepID=UPI00036D47AD|nr:acylneuraminate cytidylyltransferase family protein [Effusibacillus pohliae]